MARITYFSVMVFAMLVAIEAAGEAHNFDCFGPVRTNASAMCRSYTRSPQLEEPPSACCMAYRTLIQSVKTTTERRQLCSCIQRLANDVPVYNIANIDALLEKCGLPIIFSAYRTFDCNTVN